MFTGIVSEIGVVSNVRRRSGAARLTVEAPALAEDAAVGDSIAVNGVCLTVAALKGSRVEFDVVTETLEKTNLGALGVSSKVNMEGALVVGDRLSGHFVLGHVDGVGRVVERTRAPGQTLVRIRAPEALASLLVEKGSVAADGVSLTIFDVRGPEFSVALVPHTLEATTLSTWSPGREVNLEGDVIGRWVARLLPRGGEGGGVTRDALSAEESAASSGKGRDARNAG